MGWLGWLKRRREARLIRAGTPDQRFAWMQGRRYLVGDSYILPRDMEEMNRIDFQHYLLRYAAGAHYVAPLSQPDSILDAGCGNGRWAMEMAQLVPGAKVVGLDIVIPPTETDPAALKLPRPANYTFVQGNVMERLPFADGSFDYVHQRLLYGSLPAAKWPEVVRELIRVTRPGGWVELVESDIMEGDGPAVTRFNTWLIEATARRGTDIRMGRTVDAMLREAGLAHVGMRTIDVPIGAYGGRLGQMMEANTMAFLGGFQGLVVSQGLTTAEAYKDTMEHIRAEIQLRRYSLPYFLAYGQRL